MTTDEKLDLLVEKVSSMDDRLLNLENKFDAMQVDVTELKQDVNVLKRDVDVLKRTAVWAETDLKRSVKVLFENHTDLARNVDVAKNIEERVGVLEFDMKFVKSMLQKEPPALTFSS